MEEGRLGECVGQRRFHEEDLSGHGIGDGNEIDPKLTISIYVYSVYSYIIYAEPNKRIYYNMQ